MYGHQDDVAVHATRVAGRSMSLADLYVLQTKTFAWLPCQQSALFTGHMQ